jgi:PAS domain S-box-containing protein
MGSVELETWQPWFWQAFLGPEVWEHILLVLYALLALILLIRFRRDFAKLTRRRLLLLVGLLAATLLVDYVLVLDFPAPELLPPPGIPVKPAHPSAALLGVLPILAAGAYLGAAPAFLVGLASGVLRSDVATGGVAEPFHLAFFGFLVGFLLRQDYRGRLALIARQPLVAALVVTPLTMLLLLLSLFVHVADSGLAGFDYAVTLTTAQFGPALLEGLVAGIAVQVLYLFLPHLRPVRVTRRSPPYSRNLNCRLLYLFVPLVLMMTFVLIYAVTRTTIRMATLESVNEMARDANSAVEEIPYFVHTGQGLLTEFSNDERLWHSDPLALEARLGGDLQTLAFFDQLMLFDTDGQLLAMYPPAPTGDPELTAQEKVLLQHVLMDGATQISSAHRSRRGEPLLSFLAPVGITEDEENSTGFRALVGRTRLDVNPMINRILTSLQWTSGQGEGFLVDSGGRIVSHSDYSMLLTEWRVEEDQPSIAKVPRGVAYESCDPVHNTRELIYYLPAEGYPWAVVIRLPYEVVLARAQEVATPLLLLQVLFGGGLVLFIPLITSVLIRPLTQLAAAADRIADGDLTQPVRVASEDEVGRVGDAFEGMRVRLKDRMEDLSLLLAISQAVSATLELSRGMPFILEGALQATGAQMARIILLSADGEPQVMMSRGESREGLEALDRALVAVVKRRERPLIVENLARAKTLADPKTLNGSIKAAIALPVRTKDRTSAVMWVGYEAVRHFEDLEIDFLSMLASETAVLLENTRLFQAAEGGRRRLAAILDSTTDAVLVTDPEDRILLVNPAAERAFDIAADVVSGQKVEQIELAPALAKAFREPSSPDQALTEEIPLLDGRTLYANVSTIFDADGERIGRVAVMRDVTNFKELDEMKSEFLSTVSHDLRAPLMFMRGYANMLLIADRLNDQEREYVKGIMCGVEQINELVGDLLDLGRIEAGVGLERELCRLGGVLIEAVDSMRAQAAAKDVTLRTEPAESAAIVAGDAALLRRAVTNLVDNAIKYTPNGGIVTVGLSVRTDAEEDRAVIRVTDTGIGIAPDDQVRMFEKFYRIKRRDASDESGTGLGLAIVKSIVERHGGKVWVDSQLHEGSTFYISLPMYRDKSPAGDVGR